MTNPDDKIPPTPGLTEGERSFVHRVAKHYKDTDNMSWEYGYTMGWLMICDPVEQTVTQLVKTLGVRRESVDHVARLLATPGVLAKRTEPDRPDDYHLSLPDDAWPKAVRYSLVNIPNFHAVLSRGLQVLDGASAERRRRLVDLERLYSHLATEIPAIFDRYQAAAA